MNIAITGSYNDDTYQTVCVTVDADGKTTVYVDGVYCPDAEVDHD